ncbi:hypothetical protein [Streptomyces sp. NPDC002265]|uniref:hypothetical protein n=1 Tax=Streptomyces sp. NPDC002265 TaxID=3154415 RepID=UPI0033237E00
MAEPPTDDASSTTQNTGSARALAAIEAAKLVVGEDVAECLDAVGDLIRITGTPDVIERVIGFLARENLRVFAEQHRITVHESRAVAADFLDRAVLIWTADGGGMAIVPPGQPPATTILQLREQIAEREEEQRLAASFQDSVAAGHVEDVEAWHARTAKAAS